MTSYPVQSGYVDSSNSTAIALSAGSTFTGTAVDVSSYTSVVVAAKSDRAGDLYIDFSVDGTNWDSTISFNVAADTNEVHRLTITRRYYRVRYTNSSGLNQSYLRLQAMLGYQQQLTSNLNSTVQSDADSITARSVLMGQLPNSSWSFVPVSTEGLLEVSVNKPTLPFNSVHVESLRPVIQADSAYGIANDQVLTGSTSSGYVTGSNNLIVIGTGTTVYSLAYLESRRKLRHRSGQGSVGRLAMKFSSPASGSYLVAGLGHAEDGVYFGYKDADFGILRVGKGRREIRTFTVTNASTVAGNVTITLNGVANSIPVSTSSNIQRTVWEISQGVYTGWRAEPRENTVLFVRDSVGAAAGSFEIAGNGTNASGTFALTRSGGASVETFIPQTSWSLDAMDGTGPSGLTLNPANINLYQIKYQHCGNIKFDIQTIHMGNDVQWSSVHTISDANSVATSSIALPIFPLSAAAYSAGSTTDISLSLASYAGFTEGNRVFLGPRLSYFDTVVAVTTGFVPAFTIYNSRVYRDVINLNHAYITGISAGQDHTTVTSVFLIKNGFLGGNPQFSRYSNNSTMYLDHLATRVSVADQSQIIWSIQLGQVQSIEKTFDEEITLQPGEWLSVCARSSSGTPTVAITLNTREDH